MTTYTDELDYIENVLGSKDAVSIHEKAAAAMDKAELDWEQTVYVCPYCGDVYYENNVDCCQERYHLVEMKQAQLDYMDATNCGIEKALEYGNE